MTPSPPERPWVNLADLEWVIGMPVLLVVVVVGFVVLIRATSRAIDRGFAKMGETFGEAMAHALTPEIREVRNELLRLQGRIDQRFLELAERLGLPWRRPREPTESHPEDPEGRRDRRATLPDEPRAADERGSSRRRRGTDG